jgi:hypothetical protein
VRDAGLFGDIAHARPVEAVSRKDANRRLEQLPAPVSPPLGQGASIIAPRRRSVGVQADRPNADGL